MKNILLTSAGRRVSLLRAFRTELATRFPEAEVFAADMNPKLSAACADASRSFEVPAATSAEYIPRLLEICEENEIGMLVPTIDTELLVLAETREMFLSKGIQVVISDPDFVADCRDKRRTRGMFKRFGTATPHEFPLGEERYPVFLKPFDGSCSVDLYLVEREEEWPPGVREREDLLRMEYLSPDHFDEYTIDLYYDVGHQLQCLVPRKRIEVRSGEVNKALACRPAALEPLWERFAVVPGARGCLTLQVLVDRRDGDIFGIEINARFGGGYPLAYQCGANFPGWLIDEVFSGSKISECRDWESDLLMLRYDDEVLVRNFSEDA